jgi:hypothetical protein
MEAELDARDEKANENWGKGKVESSRRGNKSTALVKSSGTKKWKNHGK